jgi:oligopeptide/dipeptide ABC transporter ATP-binding protein
MYLGKVVELADRRTLFTSPRHPYTEALLAAAPLPDHKAARRRRIELRGEIPSPIRPPPGCRFHTRCPLADERCRLEEPRLRSTGGSLLACHHR